MDSFSLGGVARRTRLIFALHPVGFLVLAFVLVAAPSWLGTLLLGNRVDALQTAGRTGQTFDGASFAWEFVLGVVPGFVSYFGKLVLDGAVATAGWRAANGRPADLGADLRAGLRLFLPLLLVSILAYLGIFLGTLLLIVPGLILAYMWLIVVPVYVVERDGIASAFGRSRHLTADYRWRLVGITLLYGLAFGAVSGVVTGAGATLARQGTGGASVVVLGLIGAAVSAFFNLVSAAGVVAIYVELRRAKEGYLSSDLVDAFT